MIPSLPRNPVSVLLVPPAGKMCHYAAQIDLEGSAKMFTISFSVWMNMEILVCAVGRELVL